MKKILAILIASTILLSLVSCGDKTPDDLDYTTPPVDTWGTTNSSSESTTAPEPIVLPEPTLIVSEEIDWEHNAVKITLTGDGKYYFPNRSGEYVENFKYEMGYSSVGTPQAFPLPMDAPVVTYYSIADYLKDKSIQICKVDANGKVYRIDYEFSLDIASYVSDAPITLQDEFLHAAMTSYFGGEYSERDLLEIKDVYISYGDKKFQSHDREDNRIQIQKDLSGTPVSYVYSDFFDTPIDETPEIISDATLEDLKHFRALLALTLTDRFDSGRNEMYKKLSHEVARGYTVTENTWSK